MSGGVFGDSVLSVIVVETLYLRYLLTVKEDCCNCLKCRLFQLLNLSDWTRKVNLGIYVFLGKGQGTKSKIEKQFIMRCVCEAIVRMIYLDGGFKNARKFVLKFLDR
ncbi:MAG: hypothetical protein LBR09_00220 [Endomicrobium sp.]|jgi:ribonuclease-3|nr:hypothetical protein [Endomicrobium sp.]